MATATPSSYSITVRLHTTPDHALVGRVATAVAEQGGIVTAIDVADSRHDRLVVDLTCSGIDAAHTDQLVAAIDAMPEGESREIMERVCDLYVMSTIEAERAWFVEHGRLSAQQSKSVIVAVDKLCAGLRPHAQTLVDAFAIPLAWRETNLMEFLGEAGPDA